MARSHPVDVHVGARMRQRRTLLGMSQEKLGTAVGLTFQQIQKYERGSNRIGSSRLYEFAKVLDVPVSYFFDEMPSNALSGRPMSGRGRKGGFGEAGTPFEQEKDPLIKRETLELVRAYYKIREGRVRKRIFENMARSKHTAAHFHYVDEVDVTELVKLRDRFKPRVGFNLHNENWTTSVGDPPKPATISLLAVAYDKERSENAGRKMARKICAVVRDSRGPTR